MDIFWRKGGGTIFSNRSLYLNCLNFFNFFCFLGRGGQFWRKGGGIMVSNWLLQQTTLQHQHQHPPNLVFVGRGHYYLLLFILIN